MLENMIMTDVQDDGVFVPLVITVGPLTATELADPGDVHQPSEMPHLMYAMTASVNGLTSHRYFQFELDRTKLKSYNLEQTWVAMRGKLEGELCYDHHGNYVTINDEDAVNGVYKRLRERLWWGDNTLEMEIHDVNDPLALSGNIMGFFSFAIFRRPKLPENRKTPGWYGKATLNGYSYDCMLGVRGPSFAGVLQDYRLSAAFEDALAQLIVQRFPMIDFKLKIKFTDTFPPLADAVDDI